MEIRRKRALLAAIDSQLAALDRTTDHVPLRWRRIGEAMRRLRALPRDAIEDHRLVQLRLHITASAPLPGGRADPWLLAQRRTLARADCVLWQMHLRRRRAFQRTPLRHIPWLSAAAGNTVDGI